jgi:hypothetical protein
MSVTQAVGSQYADASGMSTMGLRQGVPLSEEMLGGSAMVIDGVVFGFDAMFAELEVYLKLELM